MNRHGRILLEKCLVLSIVLWLAIPNFSTMLTASEEPVAIVSETRDGIDWYDVTQWGIEGRALPEQERARWFDRLPSRAETQVPASVWGLSRDSAGMVVRFRTSASAVHVHYQLSKANLAMPHMPATGVSGLDLYARDDSGAWRWVQVTRPVAAEVKVELIRGLAAGEREYAAYLPLYNGVEFLKIGVPTGSPFAGLKPRERPLVFYGTSITHGACASRPGMAHPAILGRWLDRPVINLGFSGNGKMDLSVGEYLVQIDAAIYVIDCLPNMSPAEVQQRCVPLVQQIRAVHPNTPIVLVEDRRFTNDWITPEKAKFHTENHAALRAAFTTLQQQGVPNLYYIPGDELYGTDSEGATDASHASDLGFMRQAEIFLPVLREALATADSGLSLFERDVAPLLATRCLECHTQLLAEGGLDLSTRSGWLAGGDSGPVFDQEEPLESLLWQHVADDSMPKDRPPLTVAEKEHLRNWLRGGAAWSLEKLDPFAYSSDTKGGYDWWSLQPINRPRVTIAATAEPLPEAVGGSRNLVRNPIDYFVRKKMAQQGIVPAPHADKVTLVRRLYFDLIGLPPTPQQVAAFVDDPSADAYEKMVEQLLASPHYGERWARHWFDVVRYGETQGFERNRVREFAWQYRDWVIDALNQDLPYNEFMRYQIAGDVIKPGDFDATVATGYHVCGTWDQVGHLEGSPVMREVARWDHLEDLVGTLGQAFLGLSLHCARCHDHKYDPISQQDYYQFASLLAGVHQDKDEVAEVVLSRDAEETLLSSDALSDQRAHLQQLIAEMASAEKGEESFAIRDDGLQVLYSIPTETGAGNDASGEAVVNRVSGGLDLSLERGSKPLLATSGSAASLTQALQQTNAFTVEMWLTPASLDQRGPARVVTLSLDSGQRNFTIGQDGDRWDVRLRTTGSDNNGLPSLASPAGSVQTQTTHLVLGFAAAGDTVLWVNGAEMARRKSTGDLSNWSTEFRFGLGDEFTGERQWRGSYQHVAIYNRMLGAAEVQAHFQQGPEKLENGRSLAAILARATSEQRAEYETLTNKIHALQTKLQQSEYRGPAHLPRFRQPGPMFVLARGDMRQPTVEIAPQGLAALTRVGLPADWGLNSQTPESERRLHLANWLADARNPLPARVIVNRLWQHHFGRGLVDTTSDFGFNGGRPSHPELLDWLAAELINPETPAIPDEPLRPWSLKHMHRLMVCSATYRQASQVAPANDAARNDSDNRMLWRYPRRRLDGEVIRDSALAIAGVLNATQGGPSVRDMEMKQSNNAEFTNPTHEFTENANRRTVYRLWARSGNHPLLQSLDCPDPSVTTPQRALTITPLQALSLLHSNTLEQCALVMARRLVNEAGQELNQQIALAYLLVYARVPDPEEIQRAAIFVTNTSLDQLCLMLLNSNEFLFVN